VFNDRTQSRFEDIPELPAETDETEEPFSVVEEFRKTHLTEK
jgi:hypothetical protein